MAMADDDRDLIERMGSVTEKLQGNPVSPDGIVDNFALYGLKKRVGALEKLDRELRDEIDSGPHSLRKRVQLRELRSRMGSIHEALRKAKR
jgi:hypothetical protein